MIELDREAQIAAFIRSKGVTRCPTACVLPTQARVSAADREALQAFEAAREQRRQQKFAEEFRRVFAVN